MQTLLVSNVLLIVAFTGYASKAADADEEWMGRIRAKLEAKVSVDLADVPLSYGAIIVNGSFKVAVIASPELSNTKITLKLMNLPAKDVLGQLCKLASAEWDIRNGAILVFPAGKPPPPFKKPTPTDAWEKETLKKLTRVISLDMGGTPFTEVVPQSTSGHTNPANEVVLVCQKPANRNGGT